MKRHVFPLSASALTCLLLIPLIFTTAAQAGTHVWSGGAGTGATHWSNPANWSSGGAPLPGEAAPVVLIFPDTATGFVSTPNLVNVTIDRIEITAAAAPKTYSFPSVASSVNVRATTGDSFLVKGSGGNPAWSAPLNLQGAARCTVEQMAGRISFFGIVSGIGSFAKAGPGTAEFSGTTGANTFSGVLRVEAGIMELEKSAGTACFGGNLEIDGGRVVIQNSQQIPDTALITVTNGDLYLEPIFGVDPNAETISHLTLGESAVVYVYSGSTLTLGGLVNCVAPAGEAAAAQLSSGPNGKFSLGGATRTFAVVTPGAELNVLSALTDGGAAAGINKTGPGKLTLQMQTSLTGNTFVNAGTLELLNGLALGTTAGTVQVAAAGTLAVTGTFPAVKTLNLAGTLSAAPSNFDGTLPGPIVLSGSPVLGGGPRALVLQGVISGTATPLTIGAGTVRMTGTSSNTFTGEVSVGAGSVLELGKTNVANAVPGTLRYAGPGTVRLLADNQFGVAAGRVNMTGGGTFALNGFDVQLNYLEGTGPVGGRVLLGDRILTLTGTATTQFGVNTATGRASIESTQFGKIRKLGSGRWLVTNDPPSGAAHYPGLDLQEGTVEIFTAWPGQIEAKGGTLGGRATTGAIRALGGTVCLCHLDAAAYHGLTASTVTATIFGHNAGINYHRLTSRGTVNLNGQTLALTVNIPPITGGRYTIIKNDGTGLIGGTFTGLPEGATVTANGRTFTITYRGGASGRDVQLIATSAGIAPPRITALTRLPGSLVKLDIGWISSQRVTVQASTSLNGWTTLGTVEMDDDGTATYTHAGAATPRQFYRLTVE